jgi:hypothetical protein
MEIIVHKASVAMTGHNARRILLHVVKKSKMNHKMGSWKDYTNYHTQRYYERNAGRDGAPVLPTDGDDF